MNDDSPDPLHDAILARETQVWQALVDGDADADAAALASEFLGVYADGFADKTDHVAQLAAGPTVVRFALSQVSVRALGADHALIAYRADFQRRVGLAEVMFVGSIWEKRAGDWINIFSQDTPHVAD